MRKILVIAITSLLLVPTFASALTITRGLAVGSKGPDVTALQEFLIARDFLKVSATGYFGLMTKGAVADFQKANGLEAVGSVGPKTRSLIASITAFTSPTPVSAVATPQAPPTAPAPAPATDAPPSTIPEPQPVSAEPTSLVVTQVTASVLPRDTQIADLSVSTNKNANCRYATNPQTQFVSMSAFSITGGKLHTKTFSNLGNGNLYVYFVKCEDLETLTISTDTVVTFSVSNVISGTSAASLAASAAYANSLAQLRSKLEQAAITLNTLR